MRPVSDATGASDPRRLDRTAKAARISRVIERTRRRYLKSLICGKIQGISLRNSPPLALNLSKQRGLFERIPCISNREFSFANSEAYCANCEIFTARSPMSRSRHKADVAQLTCRSPL